MHDPQGTHDGTATAGRLAQPTFTLDGAKAEHDAPFPTSDALKSELDARIVVDNRRVRADYRFYRGDDWWQLSEAEEEVFGIDLDDWPRMMNTWHCYECFAGIAAATFTDDAIAAARAVHPDWFEAANPILHFLAFAKEFAGLPHSQAYAVMRKQDAFDLRARLYQFEDGSR